MKFLLLQKKPEITFRDKIIKLYRHDQSLDSLSTL